MSFFQSDVFIGFVIILFFTAFAIYFLFITGIIKSEKTEITDYSKNFSLGGSKIKEGDLYL